MFAQNEHIWINLRTFSRSYERDIDLDRGTRSGCRAGTDGAALARPAACVGAMLYVVIAPGNLPAETVAQGSEAVGDAPAQTYYTHTLISLSLRSNPYFLLSQSFPKDNV